jgi:GH18 family chitinase
MAHNLIIILRWYVDLEAALSCCVTDLILFSVSLKADGRLDDHWISDSNFKRARRAADAVPDRAVNVLLCIGGAGRSAGFAKAIESKQSRARLVKGLASLIEKYELDGVDLDCEAPFNSVHNSQIFQH